MFQTLFNNIKNDAVMYSVILLRIGVAIAFIYPPVSAWFNADSWLGYFPGFVVGTFGLFGTTVLLHAFGVFEIIIGLWILSGKHILVPSTLATLTLTLIILFNINQMDVLFRDISIALMSLALVVHAWPRRVGAS